MIKWYSTLQDAVHYKNTVHYKRAVHQRIQCRVFLLSWLPAGCELYFACDFEWKGQPCSALWEYSTQQESATLHHYITSHPITSHSWECSCFLFFCRPTARSRPSRSVPAACRGHSQTSRLRKEMLRDLPSDWRRTAAHSRRLSIRSVRSIIGPVLCSYSSTGLASPNFFSS